MDKPVNAVPRGKRPRQLPRRVVHIQKKAKIFTQEFSTLSKSRQIKYLKMKYVIEHMEKGFTEWVILEYAQILRDVGSDNLILTCLPEGTTDRDIPVSLLKLGLQWSTKDASHFIPRDIPKSRLCLLDPRAELDLQPTDTGEFDYFIFGGILGDHPPRDRTGELRQRLNCPGRRLGDSQMSTDTAARTTKIILDGTPLEEIKFIDYPEIRFSRHEATEMPFRYVLDGDYRPILPQGMLRLIKKDSERSLDQFF
ncbi:SPOUT methyltransferase [Brettanomyces nanus]|uniref:SPOUT methyltransferase n=1 Tax=Eeniella nana TaxID=13502 RepID=A0A875RWZ9_EENNA|nr:SPOUT methyltransferase [Brettanomyces nanus]QPG73496.1 SPOUT methyltransferase [Brettanomyces nanus]